mmetsp:Transcript_86019/g.230765  ORF Transcript_86019/g.230765 Transcript_86019/m.230765 type:complete len:256 (+) Transcript_86019:191-958(+)
MLWLFHALAWVDLLDVETCPRGTLPIPLPLSTSCFVLLIMMCCVHGLVSRSAMSNSSHLPARLSISDPLARPLRGHIRNLDSLQTRLVPLLGSLGPIPQHLGLVGLRIWHVLHQRVGHACDGVLHAIIHVWTRSVDELALHAAVRCPRVELRIQHHCMRFLLGRCALRGQAPGGLNHGRHVAAALLRGALAQVARAGVLEELLERALCSTASKFAVEAASIRELHINKLSDFFGRHLLASVVLPSCDVFEAELWR